MLILSLVIFLVVLYPVYVILTSANASTATIVACTMFLNVLFAIGLGAVYAFMAEAFPQAVRSSGLSILASIVGILLLTPHAEVLRERAAHAEART